MFNDLILDKMKKVFEYIATLLLLLAVGTSCEEGNDNWEGDYGCSDRIVYYG